MVLVTGYVGGSFKDLPVIWKSGEFQRTASVMKEYFDFSEVQFPSSTIWIVTLRNN
jgi:hypothetical protein